MPILCILSFYIIRTQSFESIVICSHGHVKTKASCLTSLLVSQDLRDLFRMEPEELLESTTQKQLHELHAAERNVTSELAEHLQLLQTLPCYAGGGSSAV